MLRISQNGSGRRAAKKGTAAEALHDMQSRRDYRELRIDKVGVRDLRFPIQVRDKAHSVQNTVATIGMFVDLPKEFKGTHMSRFVEVLNAHGDVIHVENIRDILRSLQKKLNAATSHIEIEFPYFMSKRSPVSPRGKPDGLRRTVRRGGLRRGNGFRPHREGARDDVVPVLQGDCPIRGAQPARAGDGGDSHEEIRLD